MSDEKPTIQVRIVGATDVGLIREHNEDNFIIVDLSSGETNFLEPREITLTEKGAMLVVCDGMGGAAAGEVASHMAVESMRRQMLKYVADHAESKPAEQQAGLPALPPEAQSESSFHRMARWLRDSTARANLEIWEAACADLSKNGMGTTLTGMLFVGSQIVVSQIGDSRAYICRTGTLTQITHDQSLVNQLLDSGQITPEQAKLFEHSNVILQALGVQEDIEVVLSSETLRRGDRLMLCSDGLVGVVSDEEIQEVMASTEDLAETARKLIDLARSGGGPDNITVIVAQVSGDGLAAPTPEDTAKYQTMTLPGERPAERRVFGEGYQFGTPAGTPAGTPDLNVAQPVARVSFMVWLALFTLVITLVVLAIVLIPKRIRPPQRAQCAVLVEPAGMQVWVDNGSGPVGLTRSRNELMTIELGVGQHRFVLRSPTDGSERSEAVVVNVAEGQLCNLTLRPLPSAEPPHATPDAGAGSDAAAPVADLAAPTVDASVSATAVPAASAAPTEDGDEEDPAARKHEKKAKKRKDKPVGDSPAATTSTPAAAEPATKPEPATPADKPEPSKATEKPAAEPKAAEPKAAEPKAAAPKPADAPKPAEPKAAEPRADAPKAAEPKSTEPKTAPPKPADAPAAP